MTGVYRAVCLGAEGKDFSESKDVDKSVVEPVMTGFFPGECFGNILSSLPAHYVIFFLMRVGRVDGGWSRPQGSYLAFRRGRKAWR